MVDEDTKDLISAIQAYKTGKPVQVYMKETDTWKDLTEEPNWTSDNKYRAKPFVPYRPFNSIKECYDEMVKHYPFGLLTNRKEYIQVVEIFEGTFNTCYIVIPKEKTLVNFTFTDAFNNYQFIDGSKFGVEDNDPKVETVKTYTVSIRKEPYGLLSFVKTIKEALDINLKEAMHVVNKARKETHRIDNLSKEAAEKIVADINACGGDAFVEQIITKEDEDAAKLALTKALVKYIVSRRD